MRLHPLGDLTQADSEKVGHSFYHCERTKALFCHLSTTFHLNFSHAKIRISQEMNINPMSDEQE
jgi:hypothetical protein